MSEMERELLKSPFLESHEQEKGGSGYKKKKRETKGYWTD
jgi:hypothetical protein